MDRETVKALRVTIENALRVLEGGKHAFRVGNASYNLMPGSGNATFKLEVAEKTADGKVISKEVEALQRYGQGLFGLPADALGKRFRYAGNDYEVVGLNPNAGKYPLLAKRLATGKTFRMPVEALVPRVAASSVPPPRKPTLDELLRR